jgi:DNA-binding GntR family transcriptional regulator
VPHGRHAAILKVVEAGDVEASTRAMRACIEANFEHLAAEPQGPVRA